MILGIHYFITKLKTKIDIIPRGCFKLFNIGYITLNSLQCAESESLTGGSVEVMMYAVEPKIGEVIWLVFKCAIIQVMLCTVHSGATKLHYE